MEKHPRAAGLGVFMIRGKRGDIACSGCGAHDLRRSRPRGICDSLLATAGFTPIRCRVCANRFFRRLPKTAAKAAQQAVETRGHS
jgi:hypothetical protein